MTPQYSTQLLQLAVSHSVAIKAVERFLIALIVNRYLSKDSPQSQLMNLNPALLDNRNLIHELVAHYGLHFHDTTDEAAMLIIIPPETLPQIPKCSCSKLALSKAMSNSIEEGRSQKYSRSMLKIQRPTPINRAQSDESNSSDADIVCGVSIPNHQYSSSNSLYAPFYNDIDDDEAENQTNGKNLKKQNEFVSETEICCVCLDPLLQISRAKNGETLSILKCNHVMHTSCAQEVKIYGTTNTSMNGGGGRSLHSVEPLRCPICRSKSLHTLEAQLTLNTIGGSQIIKKNKMSTPPIILGKSDIGQSTTMKRRGRRKNQEDDQDSALFLELMSMGFEEVAARRAIEAASGDKEKAVNHLLTYF